MLMRMLLAGRAGSLLNRTLNGQSFFASNVLASPSNATASVTVNVSGALTFAGVSKSADTTWASGGYSSYEVQVTSTGSAITGTTGSYLDTTQTWSLTQSGVGDSTATLTVTIRHKVRTADAVTFTVTLSAMVFSLD
jgi:hypothetical protein